MNLKATQIHQLLAALGACLAVMILAGPAAARPHDDGGSSNRSADEQSAAADAIVNQRQLELAADRESVAWYLTDEYRHFMLPESANTAIENQRQLELAADKQQVIPYLSHGILEPEQAWEVIPYLSHGVLSASDAVAVGPGSSLDRPDGYQPQLGVSRSGIPLSAGIPEAGDLIVPEMPELGTFGNPTSDATTGVSFRDRPDGYQPELSGSDFGVVADEGFGWTTTGFAASIIAALLVALAITFTRGNRHGYRSA